MEQKSSKMDVESNHNDLESRHRSSKTSSPSKSLEDCKKRKSKRAEKLKQVVQYGIDDQKEKYAKCKLCQKSKNVDKLIKMKFGNTSGLMRHFKSHHKAVYEDIYGPLPSSNPVKSKVHFEQEKFDYILTDLVIRKYLPFNFFDDEDMKNVFTYLNPEAKVIKKSRMKSLIFTRFNEMQEVIMEILQENKSKISLTLDGWMQINNKPYYSITGHFIDDDWNLHSLVIDLLPKHVNQNEETIAKLFLDLLQKYGLLEKLQGITADNVPASTTFLEQLEIIITSNFGTSFDSQNLHLQCFAKVLKLSVQAMLTKLEIDDIIDETNKENFGDQNDDEDNYYDGEDEVDKVYDDDVEIKVIPRLRILFTRLKKSEKLRETLKYCCVTTGETMCSPNMDLLPKWNLTHDMIRSAFRMKKALDLLFLNHNFQKLAIKETEWQLLSELKKYLRYFKALLQFFSREKYVTLPSVIVAFNLLLEKIENSILTLNLKWNLTFTELKLINALQSALENLQKHYKKSNWIYSTVLILDPRHKFVSFKLTEWGKDMAKEARKRFEKVYEDFYLPSLVRNELHVPPVQTNGDTSDDEVLDVNCLYTDQTYSGGWKEELERYLISPRVDGKVDISLWWKQNSCVFPNLSLMARDLLTIQATSVSSECMFSRAGLKSQKNPNALYSESARACVCLNSWANCSLTSIIRTRIEAKKQSI